MSSEGGGNIEEEAAERWLQAMVLPEQPSQGGPTLDVRVPLEEIWSSSKPDDGLKEAVGRILAFDLVTVFNAGIVNDAETIKNKITDGRGIRLGDITRQHVESAVSDL